LKKLTGDFLKICTIKWECEWKKCVLLMVRSKSGINSPVEGKVVKIPLFLGGFKNTSQVVVWDFFHQQYLLGLERVTLDQNGNLPKTDRYSIRMKKHTPEN